MDDYSHKTSIYFLKRKDEVLKCFRSFKALVENQTGKKIKILSTDNGTEYETNEFNDFSKGLALRARQLFHTLLSKIALLKGRIKQSWKPIVPCSMIKVYQISYALKPPTLSYMFKIGACINPWISRHLRKSSLVRNLMILILDFFPQHHHCHSLG